MSIIYDCVCYSIHTHSEPCLNRQVSSMNAELTRIRKVLKLCSKKALHTIIDTRGSKHSEDCLPCMAKQTLSRKQERDAAEMGRQQEYREFDETIFDVDGGDDD